MLLPQPVEPVIVTKIIPIYKNGQEATSIEVVNFNYKNGYECGYNVVVQKNLYTIGSKALYIQPDYCLPNTAFFESFTAPYGDVKKSKLGKNNRVRAIKFNFTFENCSDVIYSHGILLPLDTIPAYVLNAENLTEALGITKYEEPETGYIGDAKGKFPIFLYKTDEPNCENYKSLINLLLSSNERVAYTIKHDGSSLTLFCKKDEEGNWYRGICSRTQEKKISDDIKDSWVSLAKSSGLYDKSLEFCQLHNIELAFRGEIVGQGLKGSGNKLNPDAKDKQRLILFGVDRLDLGYAERIPSLHLYNLESICNVLSLECVKETEIFPEDYDDLMRIAAEVFSAQKSNGKVIEGIVVRTMSDNQLSCKIMNPEYDSKK